MGLDNGIVLYTLDEVKVPSELEIRFRTWNDERYSQFEYSYDICYWRKCWNVRRQIMNRCGIKNENDPDGIYLLDIDQVKQIWTAINYLNKKKIWDVKEDDSIWTYKEMRDHLDYDLLALEWLIHFMRNHDPKTYRVIFYDSY